MQPSPRIGILLAALSAAVLAACGGGSSTPNLQMSIGATPRPSIGPSLYVSTSGQFLGNGIVVYRLPVNASSTPAATIVLQTYPDGLAVDANHRLFVAAPQSDQVLVFAQPLVSSSVPAFALTPGDRVCGPAQCANSRPYDVAFDLAGDLLTVGAEPYIICGQSRCGTLAFAGLLSVIAAPIDGPKTATVYLNFPGPINGGTVDAQGNLWAANGGSEVNEFSPPFNGNPTRFLVTGGAVAFDAAGAMYVAATDGVDVYDQPFSSGMTKAFTLSGPQVHYLAFDGSGNLYATTGNTVSVYAPPFRRSSLPAVTLSPPGGANGIATDP